MDTTCRFRVRFRGTDEGPQDFGEFVEPGKQHPLAHDEPKMMHEFISMLVMIMPCCLVDSYAYIDDLGALYALVRNPILAFT